MNAGVMMPKAVWPILSLILLAGMAAEKLTFRPPADARPYHARIQQLAAALPAKINDWASSDVGVPYEAVDKLRPNVLISRNYENLVDGREVIFLLVQCQDARQLGLHYPPVCYPSQGYTELSSTRRDWTIDGLHIAATEYEFSLGPNRPTDKVVENFMVLPDGRVAPDIITVTAAANDVYSRYYGAAEIQIVLEPRTTDAERARLVELFVRTYEPILRAIMNGPRH
jgi:hypothetical protein